MISNTKEFLDILEVSGISLKCLDGNEFHECIHNALDKLAERDSMEDITATEFLEILESSNLKVTISNKFAIINALYAIQN